MMNREQILGQTPELARVEVVVKEWGGKFFVREMTGNECDTWEQAVSRNPENIRAHTVVRCLVNEQGARVFKDEDVEIVATWPARILSPIAVKARRLNKLGADAVEIEKGNSEPVPVESSTST